MPEAFLARRLIAEVLGSFVLVVLGTGAVVAALTMGKGALSFTGLGVISLAFGFAILVAVHAFGAVSGAHINPAVTIALAVTRRFPWSEVGGYVAAQLLGSFLGSLAVVAMFGRGGVDLGLGATVPGDGVSIVRVLVAEAVGTFLLMTAVVGVAVDPRAEPGWAGMVIGLTVAAAIMVIGPITGGSMNPARTFGPLLAQSLFGGEAAWATYWAYVLWPVGGAVVAALVYDAVGRPRMEEPAPAPLE